MQIRFYFNQRFFNRVYERNNNNFKMIMSVNEWDMTFVKDTIFDVNNDGFKDFIIETYGSSGCCLKARNDIFLYNSKINQFNRGFSFLNPEYFPKSESIISLSYGHPGEVHYCLMKWKNFELDTIEFLSKKEKKYILESRKAKKIQIDTIKYRNLPMIYSKANSFAWFDATLD